MLREPGPEPGYGAVVMGTGIVSIALHLDTVAWMSDLLGVLAALAWLVLAALVCMWMTRDRERLWRTLRTPPALSLVAASAVLGSRVSEAGAGTAASVLLVLAALIWTALQIPLLSAGKPPRTGGSFMVVVGLQSLAVLGALLGSHGGAAWLVLAALGACGVALLLYPLVLVRFDLRQLREGAGDEWVAGGALAISSLALTEADRAVARYASLHELTGPLHAISIVVWCASLAWLPVLVASQIVYPRRTYDVRRWSTVFPVGMYAVCSFSVGRVVGVPAATAFARIWTWVAVAVWALTTLAMTREVRRGSRRARFRARPRPGR